MSAELPTDEDTGASNTALPELVVALDEEPVRAEGFDFVAHRQVAVDAYQPRVGLYEDYALAIHSIIKARLEADGVKVNALEYRAKTVESFGSKASKPSDDDPERPRYPDPIADIRDLAGVRAITHFLSTEGDLDRIVEDEFEVVEKTDKSDVLHKEERLGYHSIHYLVQLGPNRRTLPEYERYAGLIAEIQVRTVLQHAWAEIEHDIQYKAATALPIPIRRRFMTLAGLLEIADREIQAIQEESERLQVEARQSVDAGRLDAVEITPDALKAYLDRRFGPDGRMREFSYQYEARLLRHLGFANLEQVDAAIRPYDDDEISRAIHGYRQGQTTRLDGVLLAALGEEYVRRHWANRPENDWWAKYLGRQLERLEAAGITTGTYRLPPPV